jgi:hypothetical protein
MKLTVTARPPPLKPGRVRTFNTHCCPLSVRARRALVHCWLELGDCPQHLGDGRLQCETAYCAANVPRVSSRRDPHGGSQRDSPAAAYGETAALRLGETAELQRGRSTVARQHDRTAKCGGTAARQAGGCAHGGCAASRPHGEMAAHQ